MWRTRTWIRISEFDYIGIYISIRMLKSNLHEQSCVLHVSIPHSVKKIPHKSLMRPLKRIYENPNLCVENKRLRSLLVSSNEKKCRNMFSVDTFSHFLLSAWLAYLHSIDRKEFVNERHTYTQGETGKCYWIRDCRVVYYR